MTMITTDIEQMEKEDFPNLTSKYNVGNKPCVIGCSGLARSGKDTFVKVARKILKENGYSSVKLAFADALKEELDPFLKEYYGISAWTDDTEEKNIIRPLLVAHGCQKRVQSNGSYWIDKIHEALETIHFSEDVVFISDVRFLNEVYWLHNKWDGWLVHVKKYSVMERYTGIMYSPQTQKVYDAAPNEEETKNDPLCEEGSDYRLELENVIEKELRETGIKIKPESLVDNSYLVKEIILCLSKCPSLTIRNQ